MKKSIRVAGFAALLTLSPTLASSPARTLRKCQPVPSRRRLLQEPGRSDRRPGFGLPAQTDDRGYYNLTEVSRTVHRPDARHGLYDNGRWLRLTGSSGRKHSRRARRRQLRQGMRCSRRCRANVAIEAVDKVTSAQPVVIAGLRTLRCFPTTSCCRTCSVACRSSAIRRSCRALGTRVPKSSAFIEKELNETRAILPASGQPK